MFVLGIDPGLSVTGYGVVRDGRSGHEAIAVGVIRTSPEQEVPARLAELHHDLAGVIAEHGPDAMAIEQVFVNRNLQTAISVGRASGVALLAAAQAGIPVFEYTPSAVKMALTGYGNAAKAQVQKVVAMRFRMEGVPRPADAADALAIALCHIQSRRMGALAGRVG
jgi:crossover junction endodeoxyribonuclease RuvC